MAKNPPETPQNKNPMLTKPRLEVSDILHNRIELGREILLKEIKSEIDLNAMYTERTKWHKYNLEYLKRSFDIPVIAEDYDNCDFTSLQMNPSFGQKIASVKSSLQFFIDELTSIDDRLPLFEEKCNSGSSTLQKKLPDSNKIFIVHGHDDSIKHQVARLISKLGLHEIILSEQPNAGMTIIEKFEQHAQDARYAIILLTHDDIGYPKDLPQHAKPRARQNAIAELGYFLKALGRENIAILSSNEIEMPSDFHGILYLPITNGEWEFRLAKEIKNAGLNVDLNKL